MGQRIKTIRISLVALDEDDKPIQKRGATYDLVGVMNHTPEFAGEAFGIAARDAVIAMMEEFKTEED